MNKNGELVLVAIFLIGLSAGAFPVLSVQAEEDCLAAPSGPPPSGRQWRYRTDQIKQRKCWHLQPASEKTETATATTTRPAAERPKSPPDPLEDKKAQTAPETPPGLRGSTAPASVQADGAGRRAPSAWPAAPPAASDKTAWPDPPAPAYTGKVPWPDSPAPIAADKTEKSQTATIDRDLVSGAGAANVASVVSISDDKSLGIILISAAALVVIGILVVRRFSNRSRMASAPPVPRRRNVAEVEIADDAPHDDTGQALQKLLQVLE